MTVCTLKFWIRLLSRVMSLFVFTYRSISTPREECQCLRFYMKQCVPLESYVAFYYLMITFLTKIYNRFFLIITFLTKIDNRFYLIITILPKIDNRFYLIITFLSKIDNWFYLIITFLTKIENRISIKMWLLPLWNFELSSPRELCRCLFLHIVL